MTFAVAHVVVDQVARALAIEDSWWAKFAACAAAGAAIATALLAWITRNLAKATSKMSAATQDMVAKTAALGAQTAKQAEESALSIEQAQRHHEQSLMPIVWVNLESKMERIDQGTYSVPGLRIKGRLINAGLGPAVSVHLHLRTSRYNPPGALYLGLIGPNTDRPISQQFALSETTPWLEEVPYECVTVYRTMFETEGAIVQESHSGLGVDAVMLHYIAPSATSREDITHYLVNNAFPALMPKPE